jgi:hypothetical protein
MPQILNQESRCLRAAEEGELNEEQREGKEIKCFECRHFFVTHEPAHPYGCRAMGFKARELPCGAVLRNSGEACLSHEPKERLEHP